MYPNIHEKHQYHVKQRSTMHMNKKKLIKCRRILQITKQFSMKNHIFQLVNRLFGSISNQCLFLNNVIPIFGVIYFNYSIKLQSTRRYEDLFNSIERPFWFWNRLWSLKHINTSSFWFGCVLHMKNMKNNI